MPMPPQGPGFFDKVNYVLDAWSTPCEAPWYIYVETLKPALLEAFITLVSFGWDDIARGYARPPGTGRRSGKKRGKGKASGLRGFPEFGEMIGEQLPGSEEVKGAKWGTALKTLWRIDTAAQELLFWWMVADVTNDLAYNFTSTLYETRWCQEAGKGRFSWHDARYRLVPGGIWWNCAIALKDYDIPFPNWGVDEGHIGPNGATIAYGMGMRPLVGFPTPPAYETRLYDPDSGETIAFSGEQPPLADGTQLFVISASGNANRTFRVQVRHSGAWAQYGNSVITGTEN